MHRLANMVTSLRSKWPAAGCSSVTYRFRYARPPRALPTAHFDRRDVTIIRETVH